MLVFMCTYRQNKFETIHIAVQCYFIKEGNFYEQTLNSNGFGR